MQKIAYILTLFAVEGSLRKILRARWRRKSFTYPRWRLFDYNPKLKLILPAYSICAYALNHVLWQWNRQTVSRSKGRKHDETTGSSKGRKRLAEGSETSYWTTHEPIAPSWQHSLGNESKGDIAPDFIVPNASPYRRNRALAHHFTTSFSNH